MTQSVVGLLLTMTAALVSLLPVSAQVQSGGSFNTVGSLPDVTFSVKNYDDSYKWPLNIVRVSISGKDAAVGRPVAVSPHWLEQLTVVVKNVSPKTITECGLDLSFPDSGSGRADNPLSATQLHLGVYPDVALVRHDGTSVLRSDLHEHQPISIPPGGTAQFSFAGEGPTLEAATARSPRIQKVLLRLVTVYFADSTKWSDGRFYEPTTSHNTWRELTLSEFIRSTNTDK